MENILSGGGDNTAKLWTADVHLSEHSKDINAQFIKPLFSNNKSIILAGCDNTSIWNINGKNL
jgi:WD40 repeat protein